MQDERVFLRQGDAASRWNVSERTIARWRLQGTSTQEPLPYYKIGSVILLKIADVEAYEIKHRLVRVANASASDKYKAVKTAIVDQFCINVMGWMQLPLAVLKGLPKDCMHETNSLEVAIRWLEADEAEGKSKAARATSKAVKSAVKAAFEAAEAQSSGKSADDLIQLFTKLVKMPEGALPGSIPVRDLKWVVGRLKALTEKLKSLMAI